MKNVDIGKCRDLTGMRFGRLVVIAPWSKENYRVRWLCQCRCGNQTIVPGFALIAGNTKSCGCLRVDHYFNMLQFAIANARNQQEKMRAIIAEGQKSDSDI